MKVVVVRGTAAIGRQLIGELHLRGHQVVAWPAGRVSTLEADDQAQAFTSARVTVDLANAPTVDNSSPELAVILTRAAVATAAVAGVSHYVTLSLVGPEPTVESGHFRARGAQEACVRASRLPYSFVRSTQFFESIETIVDARSGSDVVSVSPVLAQPVATEDVVAALADVALGAPVNGVLEIAGPEAIRLDELARLVLSARETPRLILADIHARCLGLEAENCSLVPGPCPRTGQTRISDWLRQSITPG